MEIKQQRGKNCFKVITFQKRVAAATRLDNSLLCIETAANKIVTQACSRICLTSGVFGYKEVNRFC